MSTYKVPEMSCGHCKASIEKAVTEMDSAATLSFNMDDRTIDLATSAANDTILATLKEAGYDAELSA